MASFKGRKLARRKDFYAPKETVTVSAISRDVSLNIQGKLGTKNCMFLLDTGATRSIVNSTLVKDLRIEKGNNYNLKTATGELVPVLGEIKIMLQLGDDYFQHDFLIADITDDCILGLDFMQKFGFIINLEGRSLKYKNIELPLFNKFESVSVRRVLLVEDVAVPAQSECIAWGKLEGDPGTQKLAMVEPIQQYAKEGVLVGRSLVLAGRRELVPIRIMNVSSTEQVLKANSVVANCENVETVKDCDENTNSPEESSDARSDNPMLEELLNGLRNTLKREEYRKARKVLLEFQSIFSKNDDDCGRTNMVQHRIDTGAAKPIRQQPRRLPLAKQNEVTSLLDQMQRQGVIEPSQSPWSSPVVLVRKKDGSMRFCVDYRLLNDVTRKDSYPLPRIDDTLDTLAGAKIFSTLDLKSGYWQVGIHPHDREKTAFCVGNGGSSGNSLWQFVVMPFGLCNAPATFERLMEFVLRGLNWKTCLVYLDDIIVLGRTFDEHLQHLCEVLTRIRNAGLKLSPKKCSLFMSQVKYLGHIVTADGVSTDPDKIQAVREWPIPNNVQELRSFLGLCTYYRRFVPNFATIAKDLHALTEKGKAFKWNDACQTAFEKLKSALICAPVLAYPECGGMFLLDTDASNTGIGAVLSQLHGQEERVIAYYSRTLSKAERNYCVTRRELLAVVEATKHFHKYLYGQKFRLRTDHSAIQWLLRFKDPEGQIARWLERLQTYDFEVQHRKGKMHGNADALSRRPCKADCKHCKRADERELSASVYTIEAIASDEWSDERLREDQLKDADLAPIICWLEGGSRPEWHQVAEKGSIVKSYWAQWDSLQMSGGVLKRLWESVNGTSNHLQIVLPKTRVKEVLEEIHNGKSGGHLGVNKTLAKLRQRFYWVNYKLDVEEWCRRCTTCAASKGPRMRTRGSMRRYNVGVPFERIAIDVAGPFPESTRGNKYVLVAMDYFTKWPEVYAIPNQEATTISDVLIANWISRFGVPMELHSDQGRNFESKVFQEVCTTLGIHKTRTTPLHPQSDGMVERFNRTLEQHLSKMVSEHQDDWDYYIPLFLMAYRSAVHDTTGETPSCLLFGREMRLPCDLQFGTVNETASSTSNYVSELRSRLDEVHQRVRHVIENASDRMKTRYDLRSNSSGFHEGDLVWLYNPQRRKGRSPKLQKDWEGPYKVVKRINDVVYRIQKSVRSKMKVVHLDRLTKYHGDDLSVRDEQT